MFNSRWALSSFAALLLYASFAHAVTISTDTVIGPGSPFNGEQIQVFDGADGPTTVRVIEGGTIRGFNAHENSHVVLDGGTNTFLSLLLDQTRFSMLSGEYGCFDSSCSTINSQVLLSALDEGRIVFFGGRYGGPNGPVDVGLFDYGIASFHGHDLSAEPVGPDYFVTGMLSDGSPISVGIGLGLSGNPQVILHEIPESSTLALVLIAVSIASVGWPKAV